MLKALDAEDSWRVPRQGHWLKLKRGGHGGPGWGANGGDTEATPGECALPDTVDLVLLGADVGCCAGAPSASHKPYNEAHGTPRRERRLSPPLDRTGAYHGKGANSGTLSSFLCGIRGAGDAVRALPNTPMRHSLRGSACLDAMRGYAPPSVVVSAGPPCADSVSRPASSGPQAWTQGWQTPRCPPTPAPPSTVRARAPHSWCRPIASRRPDARRRVAQGAIPGWKCRRSSARTPCARRWPSPPCGCGPTLWSRSEHRPCPRPRSTAAWRAGAAAQTAGASASASPPLSVCGRTRAPRRRRARTSSLRWRALCREWRRGGCGGALHNIAPLRLPAPRPVKTHGKPVLRSHDSAAARGSPAAGATRRLLVPLHCTRALALPFRSDLFLRAAPPALLSIRRSTAGLLGAVNSGSAILPMWGRPQRLQPAVGRSVDWLDGASLVCALLCPVVGCVRAVRRSDWVPGIAPRHWSTAALRVGSVRLLDRLNPAGHPARRLGCTRAQPDCIGRQGLRIRV